MGEGQVLPHFFRPGVLAMGRSVCRDGFESFSGGRLNKTWTWGMRKKVESRRTPRFWAWLPSCHLLRLSSLRGQQVYRFGCGQEQNEWRVEIMSSVLDTSNTRGPWDVPGEGMSSWSLEMKGKVWMREVIYNLTKKKNLSTHIQNIYTYMYVSLYLCECVWIMQN